MLNSKVKKNGGKFGDKGGEKMKTERDRDRQTDRDREIQRETETERDTHTENAIPR